jgi:hypothetical protein
VQFSTGRPGEVAFRPDPTHPARHWLHRVYYAQRAYRGVHRRYTDRLEDLQVPAPAKATLVNPTVRGGEFAFEASVELRAATRAVERWHVRQDSLVWRSSPDARAGSQLTEALLSRPPDSPISRTDRVSAGR